MPSIRSYTISQGDNSTINVSEDFGVSWSQFTQTGIPAAPAVTSLAVDPYNPYKVIVGCNGLYISTDGAQTFTLIPGTSGATYSDIVFIDSQKIIATGSVIALSFNGGTSFTTTANTPSSIYGSPLLPGQFVTSVFVLTPASIYASVYDKIFKSTNGGYDWIPLNGGSPIVATERIYKIYANSSIINVLGLTGMHRSSDAGANFSSTIVFLPASDHSISALNFTTFFLIESLSSDLYKSSDAGVTWNLVNISVGGGNGGNTIIHAYTNNDLFIVSEFASFLPNYSGLYSGDGGLTFSETIDNVLRLRTFGTGELFECSECPPKFTFNSQSDYCEYVTTSPPLCEVGYEYNDSGGLRKCVNIENPIDTYLIDGCPDYCTPIIGNDLRGYCKCLEQLFVRPCCYQLNDCKGSAESIITQTDLLEYFEAGNIIKIQGSDICWEIENLGEICDSSTDVIVTAVFADCIVCDPSFSLYNCKDENVILYTAQDLSQYQGSTIQVAEYPGECWQVGPNTKVEFTPEDVTLATEFQTCAICNPPIYQLNNCFNDQSFILTDSDLLNLVGKTISIQGYPGLCFTVTEPTCQCLRVTGIFDIESGVEETIDVTASTVLVNGRYQYLFTANGDDYSIVWNSTDNQWEFYNVTTSTLLAYSPIDSPCPYTSYWVPVEEAITYVYVLQDGAFASGGYQSVYVSTDFGATYNLYFDGIPVSTSKAAVIQADLNITGSVFAAGDIGIYHTTDHGVSWTAVGGSYTTGGAFNDILLYNGVLPTDLSIAVGDTFAVSTDGGVTFSDLTDSPATLYPTWGPSPQAYAIASWDTANIYVGIEDKVFKSTDNGATWTACNSDNPISVGNPVQDIVTPDFTTVVVITTAGIYVSTNNGTSFTQTLVITEDVIGAGCSRSSSNVIDVVYYPATNGEVGGIYRSTNSGSSWTLQSTITGGSASTAGIFSFQQNLATVGRSDTAYYSTDSGVTKSASSLPGKATSIAGVQEFTSCQPFCSSLIKTESCSDLIYDINVDQVFPDCDCCTTKNCK